MLQLNKYNSTKQIVDFVYRQLGAPLVKVELSEEQIIDNIQMALSTFLKYAAGQSSENAYYTLTLEGSKQEYNLPEGIIDVLNFDEGRTAGKGINTLFTVSNQLYTAGMLNLSNLGASMDFLGYHLALDFMEMIDRYASKLYQWNYDPIDNVLFIYPKPKNEMRTIVDSDTGLKKEINSPGWVLLKVKQHINTGRPGFNIDQALARLFNKEWVKFYTLALCKITLGRIRTKFNSFNSIGNTGISLDGSDLLSEGSSEKDKLEEQVRDIESWEGYGITSAIL